MGMKTEIITEAWVGHRVIIDGDDAISALVLSVEFRGDQPMYHCAWWVEGAQHVDIFPEWRVRRIVA